MERRQFLLCSGSALTVPLAGCAGETDDSAGEPDDGDSTDGDSDGGGQQSTQPDPVRFSGSGAAVRDGLDVQGGLTAVEAIHDGTSNFVVELVPSGDDSGQVFLNQTGGFDGASAALLDADTYQVDVDADGEWVITVSQPRASSGEATPFSLADAGYVVEGPYEFSGSHTATGRHDADGTFIVELFPPTGDAPETVFDEFGQFEGESTFRADGVGWLAVQSGGDWTLDVE